MVGRRLVVLLRRVLPICLRVLRRRRVCRRRLVGRLGRRIRAGGLRRILILRVLALRVLALRGILGVVGLGRVLRRDERLLLLLSLVLLGLHDEGLLGRGSFGVEQEAAFLAAHEEAV